MVSFAGNMGEPLEFGARDRANDDDAGEAIRVRSIETTDDETRDESWDAIREETRQ